MGILGGIFNGVGFKTRLVAVPEEKYRLISEPLSDERVNLVGITGSAYVNITATHIRTVIPE